MFSQLSRLDHVNNIQMLLIFLLLVVLCFIATGCSQLWSSDYGPLHWYLRLGDNAALNFGYTFLTFLILFNTLIPVSMSVTVEVVRYIQVIRLQYSIFQLKLNFFNSFHFNQFFKLKLNFLNELIFNQFSTVIELFTCRLFSSATTWRCTTPRTTLQRQLQRPI